MARWRCDQLVTLTQDMQTYASENNLHIDQVLVEGEGPAKMVLYDSGWDEREMYGEHYEGEPGLKEVTL